MKHALAIALALHTAPASAASWYAPGDGSAGGRTASGERFTGNELTAAHRTLPFGTHVNVCRGSACVTVRINDRGPFVRGRDIDLSRAAARAIGCGGVCTVTMDRGTK
jgi:rare lipoprotein A